MSATRKLQLQPQKGSGANWPKLERDVSFIDMEEQVVPMPGAEIAYVKIPPDGGGAMRAGKTRNGRIYATGMSPVPYSATSSRVFASAA